MTYSHRGDAHHIYRQQQVSALGTGRLVLLAYDTALKACRRKQKGLLTRVLQELMSGLDLSQGEVAVGLLRLYEYMLRRLRDGDLNEVEAQLRELREVWAQAVRIEEAKAARDAPREGARIPAAAA